MTTAKQTKPHVPLKDYYTVEDVSVLLGIGENMVRELAGRDKDPLPFRRLNGKVRGMFIIRSDLGGWVLKNSFLVALDHKERGKHPDYLASRTRQLLYLCRQSMLIVRIGICHRLNGDGSSSADLYSSDRYAFFAAHLNNLKTSLKVTTIASSKRNIMPAA